MEHDTAQGKKIQELQMFEQTLQNQAMQKQMLEVELNELQNALGEVARSKDEVYKVLSGVMLKADKDTLIKELNEKKHLLELRVAALEKQEKLLAEKAGKLREEITADLKKSQKK